MGNNLQIMASATAEDYTRDPTRWGSAEVAAHFPGFEHVDVRVSGATIRLRHGGSGPPFYRVSQVPLCYGFPPARERQRWLSS
jgi:hypothetical protein